jgi:hypothetical protein
MKDVSRNNVTTNVFVVCNIKVKGRVASVPKLSYSHSRIVGLEVRLHLVSRSK